MKKILVLLLFTIITILPTFATNWLQTNNKSYVDVDSIEHEYDTSYICSFWTKSLNNGSSDFKHFEKNFNKKIWYFTCKKIIDFNKNSYIIVEIDFYDLNDKLIEYYEFNEWKNVQKHYDKYKNALISYKQNYHSMAAQSYSRKMFLAGISDLEGSFINDTNCQYNQLDMATRQLLLMKQLVGKSYNNLPWKKINPNSLEYHEYLIIDKYR